MHMTCIFCEFRNRVMIVGVRNIIKVKVDDRSYNLGLRL